MAFLFWLCSFLKVRRNFVLLFHFLLFMRRVFLFVLFFLLMGLQTLRSFCFVLLFPVFLLIGLFEVDLKLLGLFRDFIEIVLFAFVDSFVFLGILSFERLVTLCYYRHYLYLFEFLVDLLRFFLLLPLIFKEHLWIQFLEMQVS